MDNGLQISNNIMGPTAVSVTVDKTVNICTITLLSKNNLEGHTEVCQRTWAFGIILSRHITLKKAINL